MTQNLYALKIMSLLALFSIVNLACADVVRCEGGTGDVTYTDTACGKDAQLAQSILVEKPPVKNVSYQQPSKTTQGRSSSWADLYIAPRTGKVDKESVRSARLRMISIDSTSNYWDARK